MQRILIFLAIALLIGIQIHYQQQFKVIILDPVTQSNREAVLILLPGNEINPKRYTQMLREIQNASSIKLWIAIPDSILRFNTKFQLNQLLSQTMNQLRQRGMSSTNVFIGGHGAGGLLIQQFIEQSPQHINNLGMVLLGSFLKRKFFNINQNGQYTINTNIPILTVSGELDGISRIIRAGQAYYRQQFNLKVPSQLDQKKFPVVTIEGMNHYQFADDKSENNVDDITLNKDLKAEITLKSAHQQVALYVGEFIDEVFEQYALQTTPLPLVLPSISNLMKYSSDMFYNSIVNAMQLQGSYQLKPACNTKKWINRPNPRCNHGSPWVEQAQIILANLNKGETVSTIIVDDSSHPVDQFYPDPLPTVWTKCDGQTPGCVLNITTVSETVYQDQAEKELKGYIETATEIKAQMVSRQRANIKNGNPNYTFDEDLTGNLCKLINQRAISRGIQMAPRKSLSRFVDHGQKLVVGDDVGPFQIDPMWIYNPLKYQKVLENGIQVTVVSSAFDTEPSNYWLPIAAGIHYCKLLSPARVVEWIMVDSLYQS